MPKVFRDAVNRRAFLSATGATAAAGLTAACAPAAPAPAAPGAPGGEAKAGWEAEWEALVKAAKQEGKLGLVTTPPRTRPGQEISQQG